MKDENKDVSCHWMILGKGCVLEIERRSTRSHSVGNSLWKEAVSLSSDRLRNK
jgi:N-acetyl-anhydromuramyl-L-alanine amidase AmpD